MRKLVVALSLVSVLSGCKLATQAPAKPLPEDSHTVPAQQTQVIVPPTDAPAQQQQWVDELEIVESPVTFTQEHTAAADNLWWLVRSQMKLATPDNKRFHSQRRWYARHPGYIKRVSERARPYLYHIVQELQKRDMPMELALLPIVESAFDPFAYSHGRASGMWQFIPETGKRFGLHQNWWYDGRRDVYYSTLAALDFLQYLEKRFKGNWLHAIAAYNSGEGHVSRAIRKNKKKNKPTDFWSLKLPKETEAYVPKLLALADLLRHYQKENLTWAAIPNEPYFAKVTVDSQIDLAIAADMAQLSMDEFYTLNPAFNHWATEPKRSTDILVPVAHEQHLVDALAKVPANERIAFKRYVIKQGDSLLKIAKKFKTTPALLRSSNGIRGNTIRAGKAILIPTATYKSGNYSKSSEQRLAAKQNRKRKGNKTTIRIQKGDSFWTLSRKHKVGMRELAAWNNMAPTDPLKIGQKLVVWSKSSKAVASTSRIKNKTRKIRYKVRKGDSLARIASKFRVRVADLVSWNKINPSRYLQPGQALTLFVDITRQY
ncbi:LysM peptidoglycan-binding domain-containing protein [Pleionea sp. CnH1-48]|uniref:lytic transglycosylase n=1 Tax=Pleionea sp. CnH1-48 TaxID=2954494 RepID=UPI0020978005|nr:LysM peptidoglycan-binding domain-containing protein [Pleionea sp. CnH1-48]MCO7225425.1 LysM peptidoglycan-binding domain-containing protein [Pleionea sp. CnH1-48]